jgi:hypothetical protein
MAPPAALVVAPGFIGGDALYGFGDSMNRAMPKGK